MPKEAELTRPHPKQSPYFHALHATRYERQSLIQAYESHTDRRLIIFIGAINRSDIAPFLDLFDDINPNDPLDLLLASPGGHTETALRLAKLCHKDREDFRVIVPDEAKSAATLLALGAEQIVMSTSSDLGPIDPQIFIHARQQYMPAKIVIGIVDDLQKRFIAHPDAYSLYGALLADIDGAVWKRAHAAIARTTDLVKEVSLCRNNPPSEEDMERIVKELTSPHTHEAVVDYDAAKEIGLPVIHWDRNSDAWKYIWRLYAKYHTQTKSLYSTKVIESRRVSLEL